MIARRIALAVAGLVLLSSGSYLFIYLYRWEWNRATIAGIFLVAAEIALVAMIIQARIAAIEKRLDDRDRATEPIVHLRATQPPPRKHFRWLTDEDRDLGVFIPVLMGAGVVFSGLAWMVEQLARTTTRPLLERGLALKLEVLALPDGGFLAPSHSNAPRPPLARHRAKTFFYLFVAASATYMSIDALGDLTQNRPELDVIASDEATLTLDITKHGWARSELAAAHALWASCQHTISPTYRAGSFTAESDGRVSFTIRPGPADSAQRRLTGCLQDATLDNLSATIVGIKAGS